MGYDSEYAARIVFDIETAALPEAAEYLEPVEPPANYKDPEKIAAYLADKRAEQVSKCALDVDLCRVVAIGTLDEDAKGMAWTGAATTETEMLEHFWAAVGYQRTLVGFNCLGFDLPVLLRRSLYLGVRAPRIQIDKFRHPRVTDLMAELSYDGKLKYRGLSFYCKRFGIEVPDPLKGSEVGQAVADNRWEDVRGHVLADVQKTARLAEKMGHFKPATVAA